MTPPTHLRSGSPSCRDAGVCKPAAAGVQPHPSLERTRRFSACFAIERRWPRKLSFLVKRLRAEPDRYGNAPLINADSELLANAVLVAGVS